MKEIKTTKDVDDDYIISHFKFIGADEYWIQYEDDEGRAWAVPTTKAKQAAKMARISFARVPDAFKDTRLDSLNLDYYREDMRAKVMMVKDYISRFNQYYKDGKALYIWSHTLGSGKTMTACAVANALIDNYDVMFMTTGTMFEKLKDTFDRNSKESTDKMFGRIKECDLLILDDMGSENMSNWTDEMMFELVNARYLSRKPTVYTSNYAINELKYNRRIIDRVDSNVTSIQWAEEGVRRMIGNMKRDRDQAISNYSQSQQRMSS